MLGAKKGPVPATETASQASAPSESRRAKAGTSRPLLKCQVGAALGEEQRQAGPTGTAAFSRRARRERRSGREALLPEPASLPVPLTNYRCLPAGCLPGPGRSRYHHHHRRFPLLLDDKMAAAGSIISTRPAQAPSLRHPRTRPDSPARRVSSLSTHGQRSTPGRSHPDSRQRREALWKRMPEFLAGYVLRTRTRLR